MVNKPAYGIDPTQAGTLVEQVRTALIERHLDAVLREQEQRALRIAKIDAEIQKWLEKRRHSQKKRRE